MQRPVWPDRVQGSGTHEPHSFTGSFTYIQLIDKARLQTGFHPLPLATSKGTDGLHGCTRGLLIRGGDVLEAAAHVDVVAFDKTGTLTVGKPSIQSLAVQHHQAAQPAGLGDEAAAAQLLAYAAALERHSTHPLAAAVLAAASAAGQPPPCRASLAGPC